MPYVFRCKQLVCLGNGSKIVCKWFNWIKKLSKFHEDFIKNYNEKSNKGYNLEVDAEYPKNLFNLHSDSPFTIFKTSIKSQVNTKKVHRVIQFINKNG